MAITKAQAKAKNKYKAKIKVYRFECYPTEPEIINKLEEERQNSGIASYIKNLIKKDIAERKNKA